MTHDSSDDPAWGVARTRFSADLHGVVRTNAGPYAVGGSGAIVALTDQGWTTVVDSGPGSNNRTLRAVDVTDDGSRIWFAGANGALGLYDVDTRKLHDHSTGDDSWRDVAVAGTAGSETVLLANESGAITPMSVDSTSVTRESPVKPGSGSTIVALALSPEGVAFAADSSGNAFRSTGVAEWTDIGIDSATVGFNDVVAKKGRAYVAADKGRLFRYDDSYGNWTPIDLAEPALQAVDLRDKHLAALDANGVLHWRSLSGQVRWQKQSLPAQNSLSDLALGSPDVAVGAQGTVVTRPPTEQVPPKPRPKSGQQPTGTEPSGGSANATSKPKSPEKPASGSTTKTASGSKPQAKKSKTETETTPAQTRGKGTVESTIARRRKRTAEPVEQARRQAEQTRQTTTRTKDRSDRTAAPGHPDPCSLLLEELVDRLHEEQLLTLLESRDCYEPLTDSVRAAEREELANLLADAERFRLQDC